VFGRNKNPEPLVVEASAPAEADPQAPKGRPTPSRKEAEAARRQARRVPADPKQAKKAARERSRQERLVARQGMMAGDERYLPERDRGPVKAFVRDYADGRRRISEFFIFIALGMLMAGFLRDPQVQATVSLVWIVTTTVVAVEMAWGLIRLSALLKQRWPEKHERKGALFYAGMRMLQIRRLRIPAPRVKPGGKSV
jgi:hypothetical protein